MRDLLTAKDIKGVVAIMPTPVKSGSDSWESRNVVDLDEAARGADSLVNDGIDLIFLLPIQIIPTMRLYWSISMMSSRTCFLIILPSRAFHDSFP